MFLQAQCFAHIETCNTTKSFIQIQEIEDCTDSMCSEAQGIMQYLPVFLEPCEVTFIENNTSFADCWSNCMMQDCLAFSYLSIGECYACLIDNVSSNTALDVQMNFIAMDFVHIGKLDCFGFSMTNLFIQSLSCFQNKKYQFLHPFDFFNMRKTHQLNLLNLYVKYKYGIKRNI